MKRQGFVSLSASFFLGGFIGSIVVSFTPVLIASLVARENLGASLNKVTCIIPKLATSTAVPQISWQISLCSLHSFSSLGCNLLFDPNSNFWKLAPVRSVKDLKSSERGDSELLTRFVIQCLQIQVGKVLSRSETQQKSRRLWRWNRQRN